MTKTMVQLKWKARVILSSLMLLLMLTVFFPGCGATEPKDIVPSNLKIVTLPYLGYATYYISQEEGYFAEQGFEVEFVKFNAASEAIPLLAQGSLDVVAGSMSASLINAIAQNINIKVVAGREYVPSDEESSPLMVRKDLYDSGELNTVAKIKGRQVAIPCLGCLNDFAVTKILETAGLSLADVKVVKMTQPSILAALENRALEVAHLGSPYSEKVKSLGYAVTIQSADKVIPGFQKVFVMYGPNLLEKNPELGKKFMVAFLKGLRQYNQGRTERNVAIIEKYLMDRETLLSAPWDPMYSDGRIKVEDILAFQDWAYANGLVDKQVTKEQLVDTRFIEYANRALGPAR